VFFESDLMPAVDAQLKKAGIRLALVLNAALS